MVQLYEGRIALCSANKLLLITRLIKKIIMILICRKNCFEERGYAARTRSCNIDDSVMKVPTMSVLDKHNSEASTPMDPY